MLKRAPVGPQSRSQQWSVTPGQVGQISVPAKFFDGVAGGRYYLINTLPLWKQFFSKLIQQKIVACDTETDGLGHRSSQIIGWCFSWGGANSYYVPVRHYTNEKQLRMEDIWDDLKLFFSDPNRITIWHNGKFDLHFLWNENLLPAGLIHDTRIMQSLLNETMSTTALKKLAVKDIHKDADKWEKGIDDFRAKFGKKNKIPKADVHYGYIPIEMMVPYAASDAHYTWVLYKKKLLEITRDSDLINLYVMEMELLWVLLTIEHEGVFIDRDHLETIGPDLEKKAIDLRAKIIADLGNVNPDSNVTLVDPLIAKGVKLYKKTKTGRFSLDVEVLQRLSSKYQVCADILEYRGAKKIKSTYVDSILEKMSDDDRLHCEYNQAVSTGRMSSKAPNLQNIPVKDKSIRKAFVPPKNMICVGSMNGLYSAGPPCGWEKMGVVVPSKCPNCGGGVITREDYVMVFIDYSQMEVRMTAHYCLQRNMNVRLADGGSMEIGKLVNQKIGAKVESFDFDLGCVVNQPVVNHWRNNAPMDDSVFRGGTGDWLVLRHEGAPHRKLVLTPQHEVFDSGGNKVLAKDLKVGDELLFREPELSGANLQVFLGSMLGDGNFKFSKSTKTDDPVENLPSANFYHGEDQSEYFQWKVDRLSPFMTGYSKPDHMNRARMRSSFQIKKWVDLMVVDGVKMPTEEVIGHLDLIGLAVWYMDDGSLGHDKRCSDTKGWAATINNVRMTQGTIDAVNARFGTEFSKTQKGMLVSGARLEKFFDLIHRFVPPCMDYKLPPHWRGKYEDWRTRSTVVGVVPVRLIESRKAEEGEPLFRRGLTQASFDIEVKDTHNYFAQDVLVSNSRDPVLLEVYNVTHQDVHTRTMCESFGMDYDVAIKVLEDETHPDHEDWSFKRKASKITNFLIIYGGGAPNLAAQLSTPKKQYPKRQAQKFIDNYFKKFRGIKRWISDTRMQIRSNHEVQNHFGRYRRFPELKEAIRKSSWHWESKWIVERCERQGVNFLIQGTCADLFKIAMPRVHRILKDAKTRLVMPIHDEIVFYWHRDEFGHLNEVVEQMEDFSFRVPMTVDVSWTTDNWALKKALH